jgi:SPX domain protein involved in polyphosphate accumulation
MTPLTELAKQCGATQGARNSGGFHAEQFVTTYNFDRDQLTAFVERIREEAAADTARLNWLDNDGSGHAFKIGNAWYTREAAGSPHHKASNIRAAIDASIREARDA